MELVGALIALTLFAVMLASVLAAAGSQVALTALARDAARAASLRCDRAAAITAVAAVLRSAEASTFTLDATDGYVAIRLERPVRLLGLPAPVPVSAGATALQECPW